jgi:acyl-coenzyme A synthetase/AMP-(fatty) acid ligase
MVINQIYERARLEPHRTAVIWNGATVTYAGFARGIEATRQALEKEKLPPGSTAVVMIASLLESWTAMLALSSLGVNTIAVMSLKEALALRLQKVSCFVMDQPALQQNLGSTNPWPNTKRIGMPRSVFEGAQAGEPPELPRERPPQGGHILYTSGTTGTYKKLFMSSDQLAPGIAKVAKRNAITRDSVWHVAFLGAWTAIGYRIPMAVWQAGGCVVFDQRPNWAEQFTQQGITNTMLLPRMVDQILKALKGKKSAPPRGDWQL